MYVKTFWKQLSEPVSLQSIPWEVIPAITAVMVSIMEVVSGGTNVVLITMPPIILCIGTIIAGTLVIQRRSSACYTDVTIRGAGFIPLLLWAVVLDLWTLRSFDAVYCAELESRVVTQRQYIEQLEETNRYLLWRLDDVVDERDSLKARVQPPVMAFTDIGTEVL
jgi:uncharacterized coiled-coil protein SlyX